MERNQTSGLKPDAASSRYRDQRWQGVFHRRRYNSTMDKSSATRPPGLRPPDGAVSSYDLSGQGGFSWSTRELVVSEDGKNLHYNILSNSVSVSEREGPASPSGDHDPCG